MVCFGFTFWFRWQCHNLGLWLRLVKESWGEENPSPAVWRSPSVPDPNPELCDGCWSQERARETLVQKQTGRLCPSHWRRMSAAAPVAYPPSGMHALAQQQQQQQLPAFLREWRGEVRRALPSFCAFAALLLSSRCAVARQARRRRRVGGEHPTRPLDADHVPPGACRARAVERFLPARRGARARSRAADCARLLLIPSAPLPLRRRRGSVRRCNSRCRRGSYSCVRTRRRAEGGGRSQTMRFRKQSARCSKQAPHAACSAAILGFVGLVGRPS